MTDPNASTRADLLLVAIALTLIAADCFFLGSPNACVAFAVLAAALAGTAAILRCAP